MLCVRLLATRNVDYIARRRKSKLFLLYGRHHASSKCKEYTGDVVRTVRTINRFVKYTPIDGNVS